MKYLIVVEIIEGGLPMEEKQLKELCAKNNIVFKDETP